MSIPASKILEWDHIARNVGPTPIYDEHGRIVPIGERGGGKHVYVVWYGRALGVFCNWGLCGAMVNGFPGALYEGFRTLKHAEHAWLSGPSWDFPGGPWTPPLLPRAALPTPGHASTHVQDTPPPSPATSVPQEDPSRPKSPRKTDESPFSCADLYHALPAVPKHRHVKPAAAGVESGRATKSPAAVHKERVVVSTGRLLPAASATTTPSTTTSSLASTATSTVVVPEGRAYAVVRGENPGVYMDKHTAAIMMGATPGGKIHAFRSRQKANVYFERQRAAGEVGLPVMQG